MIVDASVAFKWIVDEELSDQAEELIANDDLLAPSILLAEVGHAVSKQIRRGQLSPDGVVERLVRLPDLLKLEASDNDLGAAWGLAMDLDHSFYDCLYLALAQRLDDVLVTADLRFVRKLAAKDMGHHVVMLGDHPEG